MNASDKKVAFLVDFDNVATDVIEQALNAVFKDYGAAHIRRAYCNAEQALREQHFLKRLGLRAIVNLAIGKNSTDIALAVDAMELAISEKPDVIVLVSSDSDFAPLVLRLREKGAWLRGFGQYGKTGDGVIQIYDQFNELAHGTGRSGRDAPAPTKAAGGRGGRRGGRGGGRGAGEAPRGNPPARAPRQEPVVAAQLDPVVPEQLEPIAEVAPVADVPVLEPVATPEPAPAAKAPRAAKPAGKTARKTAPKAPAADVEPAPAAKAEAKADAKPAKPAPKPKAEPKPAAPAPAADPQVAAAKEINAILALLPKLADGQWHELGAAAKVLKDAGLLAKNAPSTKLFRKHPKAFELQPEKNPNRVRFGHG
jgi:uncharacterized protein (TIGR00288 family)